MKAMCIDANKNFVWQDVPEPECHGEFNVKIAVKACAVNRADLMQRQGIYAPPEGWPLWPGLECAGEILECPADGRFKVGDRVCALLGGGGYAERVVVPEGMVMPMPKGFDFWEAAGIPEVYATAYLNLKIVGEIKKGETFFINGGEGGLGVATIQLAKHVFGAKVVAQVASDENGEFCMGVGADVVSNRFKDDLVKTLTENPPNVAIDPVGGPLMGKCIATMPYRGRWISLASMAGPETMLDVNLLWRKNLRVIGSTLRSRTPEEKAQILAGLVNDVYPAFEARKFAPFVHKVMPVEEASEAHAILERGENRGKVVLTVGNVRDAASAAVSSVKKSIALSLSLAAAMAAFASPEWKLVYEKPGATNTVTAVDNRTAISVDLVKSGDQWTGKVRNREPGAVVRSLEILSDPFKVDTATDAFYIPWSTGGSRIKVWPDVGWVPKTDQENELATEFDKEYVPDCNFWVPKGDGLFEVDPRMRMPGVRGGMQFMTVANKTRGLYIGSHDPRFTCKDFTGVYDAKSKTFVLGVKFNLWLRSGDDFVVTPVVMARYAGDWHVAAKRYREWWNRCFRVAYVPDRVKDMTGVFIVLLKQQNDEIIWPYTEFDSLGRCAQSYGFDHVEFHAWGKGGHDRLYPEYEPDPLMGGKEGLIKGVQTLKDMGIHATVYSNGQLQERETTDYWRTKGRGGAIVKRDGNDFTETWHKFKNRPAHTFDVVCYHQEAWKDRMLEICRDAMAYGFEGFFYDQIGVSRPRQCFAANHGHRPGDWVYTGDRHDLFKSIADVIHSEDPEFVLSAEGFHDAIFDSCAWFEGWAEEGFAWSRFDKEYVQDFYPEFVLYTFPEIVTTDRSYTPSYDRRQLNGAVVLNLRVNFAIRYRIDRAFVEEGKVPTAADTQYMKSPTDHEAMAKADWAGNRAYMKLVNEWRKANRDLLLRGTFKADEGFEIEVDGDYVANRWDSSDGRTGILVWNGDMARSQAFKVKYNGQLLYAEEPEAGKVCAASAIPANTLRLFVFKTAD